MTELGPRERIREALCRVAPEAEAAEVDRYAAAIVSYASWTEVGRFMASRRGTAPALRSLEKANRRLGLLMEAIAELGADEVMALKRAGGLKAPEILQTLGRYNAALLEAYDALAAAPVIVRPPRKRGRPSDAAADRIVRHLGNVFKNLTGQAPTRQMDRIEGKPVGDFDGFLREVFAALKISSNVDYRNRKRARTK